MAGNAATVAALGGASVPLQSSQTGIKVRAPARCKRKGVSNPPPVNESSGNQIQDPQLAHLASTCLLILDQVICLWLKLHTGPFYSRFISLNPSVTCSLTSLPIRLQAFTYTDIALLYRRLVHASS